jgi:hypothetical protein
MLIVNYIYLRNFHGVDSSLLLFFNVERIFICNYQMPAYIYAKIRKLKSREELGKYKGPQYFVHCYDRRFQAFIYNNNIYQCAFHKHMHNQILMHSRKHKQVDLIIGLWLLFFHICKENCLSVTCFFLNICHCFNLSSYFTRIHSVSTELTA